MVVYPGGTPDEPNRKAYSFFTNCFSDLGRTRTFDGHSNLASRLLFTSAMLVGAMSLFVFFRAFARVTAGYRQDHRRAAARLSHVGALTGIVAAGCFIVVACTPWDLYMSTHISFVLWAFGMFLLGTLLNVLAIILEPNLPRRAVWAFAVFSAMLAAYIPLLMIGMRGIGPAASAVVQATGQKVIVYAAILTVLVQSLHMRRHVRERK